jgi:hypothetical protein
MALDLFLLWRKNHRALHGAVLILLAFLAAFLLQHGYILLFSVTTCFLLGRILFNHSFTYWKWIVSSALLYATFWITLSWQQMYWITAPLPSALTPLPAAFVFAFCSQCSVLPYLIKKDAVHTAFDSCDWESKTESELLALEVRELYQKIKVLLREHPAESKVREELETFAEQTILLCYRMQQICTEIETSDDATLEQQISDLEQKVDATHDLPTRRQYERALASKRKQKEQRNGLRLQAERLRSQAINYVSTLENMRFAYANRHFSSATNGNTGIEFFLQMTQTHTDNIYETTEAYLKL